MKLFISMLGDERMIEVKHLKTITTLRETGSLTATATALHLTQSALSHQIKDLEARIGSQLFLRKTRPVRFTVEGKLFLDLADDILPKIYKAESDVAGLKKDVHVVGFIWQLRVPFLFSVANACTQRISDCLA